MYRYRRAILIFAKTSANIVQKGYPHGNPLCTLTLIRKLAMIELSTEGFNNNMSWDGHKLSEYPVVLYGFDSKPKFYEFMVLDAEGKEIGTVRTHSRRKTGGVLNQVSDNVKNYQSLTTKSGSGSKLFADYGGNLYGGFVSKSGDSPETVVDLTTGESENNPKELTDEEILEDLSVSLRESAQEATKVTDTISDTEVKEKMAENNPGEVETQIDSLGQRMHQEHEQRDEYWAEIEEKSEELLETSDEEIVSKSKGWFSGWSSSYNDKANNIMEYRNNLSFRNDIGDWCGPWAMAWIYNTKVEGGADKNNHRNSDGKISHFHRYTTSFSGGDAMFPWQMFLSMAGASRGKVWVMPWFSWGRKNAYYHVRHGRNPVVISTNWGSHWKVGYGADRNGWKKWPRYYFYVKDNGYSINVVTRPVWHRASWFFIYVRVYD